MGIILSIITVVALISIYDYFTARNWQQVTSPVRNNIVFQNRNKKYGAFEIRRDYNKRLVLILLGMTGSMGAAFAAYKVVKTVPSEIIELPKSDPEVTIVIPLDELIEPEILPEVKLPEPKMTEIIKFREMVASDDPSNEKPPLQDDIEGKQVGNESRDKDEDGTEFVVPVTRVTKRVIEETPAEPEMYVDEEAQFPGGVGQMMKFLQLNIKYPQDAVELGIQGKCHLQFVVDKDGEISRVKVLRGLADCPNCDREAQRVIKKMPRWKPGKKNGKVVDSYFQMPINFQLQ